MNTRILNRDFQHPADGWYQIEARGNHPNRAAGVLQVIDETAAGSIVNRFNADAQAGRLSHGGEMLVDHEHFKDRDDQETRAYGWLQQLQNRADGIYGRIRWTTTGRAAVDGGDYRFFSTEYDPSDLSVLNDGKPRRVRPMRLAGLTLTNMNNNKGQKPITNRVGVHALACPDSLKAELQPNFAGPAYAESAANQPQRKAVTMQSIAHILGLAAEAGEDAILTEVTRLTNRGDITAGDLAILRAEHAHHQKQNTLLLNEQIDALLDTHGVKEDKTRNRLKLVLAGIHNREERVAALADFGFGEVRSEKVEGRTAQTQLRNRDTRPPLGGRSPGGANDRADQARAARIHNRAVQIQKDTPNTTLATAYRMAQAEIEQTT
jgi:phage I-like protein